MKKTLFMSVAVIMALGTTQMNAQSLSGGIKANANMSNFIMSDLDNLKAPMRVGASIGGFMKWDITEHFALQPELMFHFKANKFEQKNTNAKTSYEYYGIEIPVYAMGQMQMGNGRGYIGIGPYVGMGFTARTYPGGTNLYGKTDTFQRWDFGAGALLGYEFSNRIQINAGYQIGFINALDAGKDDATMLPQTVSLGIGYRF